MVRQSKATLAGMMADSFFSMCKLVSNPGMMA